jgi:hypothetical protein
MAGSEHCFARQNTEGWLTGGMESAYNAPPSFTRTPRRGVRMAQDASQEKMRVGYGRDAGAPVTAPQHQPFG